MKSTVVGMEGDAGGGVFSSPSPVVAVGGIGLCRDCSVATVARLQVAGLSERYRVWVVTDSPGEVPMASGLASITPPRVDWLRRFSHVPREWLASRKIARHLQGEFEGERAKLVVLHSHALAAIAAPPLRRAGVRVVLVVHGDIRDRPPGTYDRLVTAFYRRMTPVAYRGVDLIVVGSEAFAALIRSDPEVRARVAVIAAPVGVSELGDLSGPRKAPQRGLMRIGFFGRLSVEKGPLVLSRALALLADRGVQYRSIWVGDGPLRASLEQDLDESGLRSHAEFLGWRPRSELGALYRSVDLVCMPSLSEPQGLVAVEAQMCGTPVVASGTGGLVAAVRPGLDGELAEPGNPADLAEAILRAERGVAEGRYHVPDRQWLRRYDEVDYSKRLASEFELLLTPA